MGYATLYRSFVLSARKLLPYSKANGKREVRCFAVFLSTDD